MRKVSKREARQLSRDNEGYPAHLVQIPGPQWSGLALSLRWPPIEIWRSRQFLLQIFKEKDGIERLTVCRTRIQGKTWQAGITWDDLQRLKSECGRGKLWAVEIFPAEGDVINIENMRHLWVLPQAPSFAWRSEPHP